ncbi:Josephin-1-like protein [Leptotrombidium deliense]|uniref:ubiquitinyl hydrolase 1 n=1 Tax=Leptotrombidium deliense TaxID=299467 RepID=A0A443SK98_9ACAR|nr:Josephin-1-like protein [Leptotrombidium deliense]
MTEKKVYHEKQVKQLCALHTLNNLLQANVFTQKELDSICKNLSPNNSLLNPHKSFFGLGNYDVNVIMCALQTKQLEAIWFDKRKDPECLELSKIYGFILNLPNPSLSHSEDLLMSRKHWIAVRKIEDLYYNLDSKLTFPEIIGKVKRLCNAKLFMLVSKILGKRVIKFFKVQE